MIFAYLELGFEWKMEMFGDLERSTLREDVGVVERWGYIIPSGNPDPVTDRKAKKEFLAVGSHGFGSME